MNDSAQKRALRNYRHRLSERGMSRFDVLGLDTDRVLIRSLAKRLAESDPAAAELRIELAKAIKDEVSNKGGVLAALRRSPLVGADLKLAHPRGTGRKIKL